MKTLESLTEEIEIWEGWRDQYKEFVPLFIDEASKGKSWEDWENRVFVEYFEKSRNQCVSSLQQGYFTRDEQESIKANWMEIAPLIQQISLSQDTPLFDVFHKMKETIRKYTKVDRKAATNRLIAALQPNLLSTIVNEDNISQFIKLLNENIDNCSIPITGDWFRNSNNVWKFYIENITSSSLFENVTLPWQTYELLLESKKYNK